MTATALKPTACANSSELAPLVLSGCVRGDSTLPRSDELLGALVRTSPRPLCVKNTQRQYVAANLAYAEMLGLSPEDLIGRSDDELLSPVAALKSRVRDEGLLARGGSRAGHIDLQVQANDCPAQSGVVMALREQGEVVGLACWLDSPIDGITGDQRLMSHLAYVAHELRSPLTGVIGLARLCLGEADLPTKYRPWLEAIVQCGEHLNAGASDMVDVGMLLSGQAELRPQPVELGTLLAEVIEWVRPMLGGSAVQLSAVLCPASEASGGSTVVVDGRRLRQLLLNLLTNAARATRAGQVLVRCSRVATAGAASECGRWRFEVQDTGCGIDPERLRDLQRRGKAMPQRGGDHASRSGGIGLLISSGLAKALGGELTVSSAPGVGTTFRFEIEASSATDSTARSFQSY